MASRRHLGFQTFLETGRRAVHFCTLPVKTILSPQRGSKTDPITGVGFLRSHSYTALSIVRHSRINRSFISPSVHPSNDLPSSLHILNYELLNKWLLTIWSLCRCFSRLVTPANRNNNREDRRLPEEDQFFQQQESNAPSSRERNEVGKSRDFRMRVRVTRMNRKRRGRLTITRRFPRRGRYTRSAPKVPRVTQR